MYSKGFLQAAGRRRHGPTRMARRQHRLGSALGGRRPDPVEHAVRADPGRGRRGVAVSSHGQAGARCVVRVGADCLVVRRRARDVLREHGAAADRCSWGGSPLRPGRARRLADPATGWSAWRQGSEDDVGRAVAGHGLSVAGGRQQQRERNPGRHPRGELGGPVGNPPAEHGGERRSRQWGGDRAVARPRIGAHRGRRRRRLAAEILPRAGDRAQRRLLGPAPGAGRSLRRWRHGSRCRAAVRAPGLRHVSAVRDRGRSRHSP